ncbi:lipopolysaccharide kinase InaA family protein [Tuwongella immobilis]|uniref:Lipopolysaccharide core heptose(I) kinase RfaP n=1 Tax=Tuwongella immobilis TaxID=692036 RepID=A0A6C2YKM6_9BACT|nr:lipopolysaccharide kinase InaA family protein [Tuwongella immobilis]VIP02130.1 heptose kinase : Lipopolysaccharide kinase (Kdo/WaaP) family OS=Singulisphaera acidiphila (strain ATCC BAA-1392 / DSM 18658 / VKM B-2454 / MOB10) GN=Sinac_3096 PE=4 SV=1: Kdo [Tuwongella immobilis]VTS00476.1 heptose kinase : Lipopolysaccharide kinase (Kdo/WaaP) family OS=Singulisphaera acidiphila (strain ATCC BAA-1392 / DSM 18658 / VKM B-2454 / MOB10) GN=Sinac_3096 PE=4 SV=1: Kdo [Tuwongella immobilis]
MPVEPKLARPGRDSRAWRWIECAPEWPALAGTDWVETIFEVDVQDRLHRKQGRSIARWTLESEAGRCVVYLKRHFVLPRMNGVLARIWPRAVWSPGMEEWQHLQTAAQLGVRVPRAMAAGQVVGPDYRVRGFIAVEELADQLALHEAIPLAARSLEPLAFDRWKRGLIGEMARLARLLHDANYFHQDLYLCHFYIPRSFCLPGGAPSDWTGEVAMIDFHRLTHRRVGAFWSRVKDLAQLLYSSDEFGVTERDRLRFARAYGLSRRGWSAWSWRLIGLKAARYRNHNRKAGG